MDDPVRFASGSRSGVLRVVGWKMNLAWTDTPPTDPGFYWMRPKNHRRVPMTIAKVSSTQYDKERGLKVERAGAGDSEWLNEFTQEAWRVEWAGPIPQPEEPTEGGGR